MPRAKVGDTETAPPPGGPSGRTAGDAVTRARSAMLEGVGREIAASFPGITRLGGQVVAALYLEGRALSMDELSEQLGRAKSNVFANLRALEAAGIVERTRAAGKRHDAFALRGKYPDVIVGAYLGRLRSVVHDKVALSERALGLLGEARGEEADALREKLEALGQKYRRFAEMFERYPLPAGPVDLEAAIDAIPPELLAALAEALRPR